MGQWASERCGLQALVQGAVRVHPLKKAAFFAAGKVLSDDCVCPSDFGG